MGESELIQAIGAIMDAKLEPIVSRLDKLEHGQSRLQTNFDTFREDMDVLKENMDVLKEDIDVLKEDIDVLKEDSKITRVSVNTLLDWAEDAQIEVKIPLYKKAK